jgi:hypothetical protein
MLRLAVVVATLAIAACAVPDTPRQTTAAAPPGPAPDSSTDAAVPPGPPSGKRGRARPAGPPLDISTVVAKVRSARGRIKKCYVDALKRDPRLGVVSTVKVVLRFTVKPSGGVDNVQIQSPFGGVFETCVEREVGSWTFTPFGGTAKAFRQRITFRIR